jgi:hypothetical protein
MKRILFPVLIMGLALSFAACGKDKGEMKGLIADKMCSLSIEKEPNRIIGRYMKLSMKAKRVDVKVNGKPVTVYFTDETEWTLPDEIKEIWDIRGHKGRCMAFDYKKEGEKYIAEKAIFAEEFEVDQDLVIGYDKFVELKDESIIVDCRPGWKSSQGTIPGAKVLPPGKIGNQEFVEKLLPDKDKQVIFFCGGFT